ncbi:MAG: four helix bundle protein [Opitutales bacterium]
MPIVYCLFLDWVIRLTKIERRGMKYQHFEELPVWKTAAEVYNRVLDLFEKNPALISSDFRRQLDRAALSISNNIAEGFDRATTGELSSFLSYARGSAAEVRSMILVVADRLSSQGVLNELMEIERLADQCVRQLSGWRRQIAQGNLKGSRESA